MAGEPLPETIPHDAPLTTLERTDLDLIDVDEVSALQQ